MASKVAWLQEFKRCCNVVGPGTWERERLVQAWLEDKQVLEAWGGNKWQLETDLRNAL